MGQKEIADIEASLQAANSGDFKGALEVLRGVKTFDVSYSIKLYEALAQMQKGWLSGSMAFKDYFNWLSSKSGELIKEFTVFDGESENIRPMLEEFAVSGDGKFNYFGGLELVTIGDQTCSLSLKRQSFLSETQIIHFVAAFPSNVGNDFFVELSGAERQEVFRFSNNGVALMSDSTLVECDARQLKLYTIVLQDGILQFYVNGMLQQIRRRKPSESPITSVTIRLLGDRGADLGGIIYGLELWKGNNAISGLFGENQKIFINRLKYLMAQRKTDEVYRLLSGIDNDWAYELTDELLLYLDDCLISDKGFQEWVFQTVLSKVRKQESEKWQRKNVASIPSPILSVRNVTAQFMVSPNNTFSIMSMLRRRGRKRFLALDNVSFDIYPGDIVGIIGENGAGKSTLLKTVAGLVPINDGYISLKARHMLLSPGLGVRNELTGRENAYLAGVFMGLTKNQMDALIDEIIEFSELGEAIDKPFKYYSDGMKGRLVFSLATCVSPDLLMLDELLSAGDIKFQQKAAERMDQIIDGAKSVVVVTHSMPFVTERCNKAILINKGRVAFYGDPKQTVSIYLNQLHMSGTDASADFNPLNVTMQQHLQQGSSFESSVLH